MFSAAEVSTEVSSALNTSTTAEMSTASEVPNAASTTEVFNAADTSTTAELSTDSEASSAAETSISTDLSPAAEASDTTYVYRF